MLSRVFLDPEQEQPQEPAKEEDYYTRTSSENVNGDEEEEEFEDLPPPRMSSPPPKGVSIPSLKLVKVASDSTASLQNASQSVQSDEDTDVEIEVNIAKPARPTKAPMPIKAVHPKTKGKLAMVKVAHTEETEEEEGDKERDFADISELEDQGMKESEMNADEDEEDEFGITRTIPEKVIQKAVAKAAPPKVAPSAAKVETGEREKKAAAKRPSKAKPPPSAKRPAPPPKRAMPPPSKNARDR